MKKKRPTTRISFPVNKQAAIKTMNLLDRWIRQVDIYYVKDFSVVLKYLEDADLDTSKMADALRDEDWTALSFEQIQFLIDWEQELTDIIAPIKRCAVYFLSPMERKKFQINRSAFGECDRHVITLSMYELIMSCVYRQINKHHLAQNDALVERAMMCHRGWFQWQTDVERIVIWIRRKEYENIAGWRPFLYWKLDKIPCPKCKIRFTRLFDRVTSEIQTVLAYGRPFNSKNYFGEIENQPEELRMIERLKVGRGK